MLKLLGILAGAAVAFTLASAASAWPQAGGAAQLASPSMAQQVQSDGERFDYPRIRGAIVDWCTSWANGCGWGGAHQFCHMKGYARATSWNITHPGRTFVVGSDRFCDGGFCKGFRNVTCSR